MIKKWLLVLVVVAALCMSCSLFGTPDYVGTWSATLASGAVVTMVFEETTFSVTVVGTDTYVITGDLAESTTEGDLDATITGVSQAGTALSAAQMTAFLAANSLTAAQTFTVSVTGESMTISGALLLALTGATSITAAAA
jgi:hypothetical protein